jgi:hypothetical protein
MLLEAQYQKSCVHSVVKKCSCEDTVESSQGNILNLLNSFDSCLEKICARPPAPWAV